jgi:hypothetical protein
VVEGKTMTIGMCIDNGNPADEMIVYALRSMDFDFWGDRKRCDECNLPG